MRWEPTLPTLPRLRIMSERCLADACLSCKHVFSSRRQEQATVAPACVWKDSLQAFSKLDLLVRQFFLGFSSTVPANCRLAWKRLTQKEHDGPMMDIAVVTTSLCHCSRPHRIKFNLLHSAAPYAACSRRSTAFRKFAWNMTAGRQISAKLCSPFKGETTDQSYGSYVSSCASSCVSSCVISAERRCLLSVSCANCFQPLYGPGLLSVKSSTPLLTGFKSLAPKRLKSQERDPTLQ